MVLISAPDIKFILSGGVANRNPSMSLGGQPSAYPVSEAINGLFSDVTSEAAVSGFTDYRCFYIYNSSESSSLYSSEIHINEQASGGAFATLGIHKATEVQTVSISGNPSSGFVTFLVFESEFSVNWGDSIQDFALNFKELLNSEGLSDISVSTPTEGSSSFELAFEGQFDNKSHELVTVVLNSLVGDESPSVSISRKSEGSPINSVAPLIPTASTQPARVSFFDTSNLNRISIGNIEPGDLVPIWVKRTTPPNTEFKEFDTASIRLSGDPFGAIDASVEE